MGDDQFAHHVDEPIQAIRAHPHGGVQRGRGGLQPLLGAQRASDILGRGGLGAHHAHPQGIVAVLPGKGFHLVPQGLPLGHQDVPQPRRAPGFIVFGNAGRLRILEQAQQLLVAHRLQKRPPAQSRLHPPHQFLQHVQRPQGQARNAEVPLTV